MTLTNEAADAVGDALPLLRSAADDLAHDAQTLPDLNRASTCALLSVLAFTAHERAIHLAADVETPLLPRAVTLAGCLQRLIDVDPPNTSPAFLEFVHELAQLVAGLDTLTERHEPGS